MKRRGNAPTEGESETAERLLGAAEQLFGERDYDGVGMRLLAKRAKVNLGAVTYHFGTKEALYTETFMRRFRPMIAERLRRLEEAEAGSGANPVPVDQIVDCMIRPPYMLGLAHPRFPALLARSLFIQPPFLAAALHRDLEPNEEAFVAALGRALPGVPEDLIRIRIVFGMGALLIFSMHAGRMSRTRSARLDDGILRELVEFISAGLRSAAANSARQRPILPLPLRPPRR